MGPIMNDGLADVILCAATAAAAAAIAVSLLPRLCQLVDPPLAQRLLAALEAAQRVVELLAGGAPQQELERLCGSFLDDLQVGRPG